MKPNKLKLSISELSELADVPKSTIKFYIRKDLLPKPKKTAHTRGNYSQKHLNRLNLIKKIQKEGDMSLNKIREILKLVDADQQAEHFDVAESPFNKKAEIIQSSTTLFHQKGYETVTITDITATAKISRASFYKYFKSKKDLFLAYIQTVLSNESMKLGIGDATDEENLLVEFDRDAGTLSETNPLWRDMIKTLSAAATNNPEEFGDKLKEVMHHKIDLYTERITEGIKQGVYRDINPRVMAIMVLGIQDYCSEYLQTVKEHGIPDEMVLEEVKSVIRNGMLTGTGEE